MNEQFWSKVNRVEGGCWLWTGAKNELGYGRVKYQGRTVGAHRVAYFITVGPIPDGTELDHLCRVPACVNPAHLEPVSHRVNVLRGSGVAAQCAQKTQCPRGHEYTPENTRVWGRKRYCRSCMASRGGDA